MLFAFLLYAFLSGCDQGIESPNHSLPNLGPANVKDIRLDLVGYDTVKITHTSGTSLVSGNIVGVGVGVKDSKGYRELSYRAAIDDARFDVRHIQFEFIAKVDASKIFSPMTIRYYFLNSTFQDVDTSVATYRFPYSTTEVVITDAIFDRGETLFEDIDVFGNKLYFRSEGYCSFYEYDLATGEHTYLHTFGGGNNIAVDSIYMFLDYSSWIYRFNLRSESVDLVFPQVSTYSVYGLDTYDRYLYVLTDRETNLQVYTYDGKLIDSMAINPVGYYMTIEGGILYSGWPDYPNSILRYDLKTKTHLPPLLAPSREFFGIKAIDGKLYFCDFTRAFVGCVPISDLRNR
jgi:hypothetical protein